MRKAVQLPALRRPRGQNLWVTPWPGRVAGREPLAGLPCSRRVLPRGLAGPRPPHKAAQGMSLQAREAQLLEPMEGVLVPGLAASK